MFNLSLPFAHVIANFILDGKTYEIEQFKIGFSQPSDYKGQPQYEMKGGQIMINLAQAADDNLYLWAKKSTLLKNGTILFQTDMGITLLEISFINAYCINLTRNINAFTGTSTSLIIAPEQVSLNGEKHDNSWVK